MPSRVHLPEQLAAARAEIAARVGALRVNAGAVMRRADGAEAVRVRALEMPERDDGVGAFEAEHVADRGLRRRSTPWRLRRSTASACRVGAVPNLHHLAALLHGAIPGELPLCLRPRLLRRMPAGQRVAARHVARDLRGDAEADAAAPHFGKTDRAAAAIRFVGLHVCSRARISAMGRVKSRFHSSAFIERSRWASKISTVQATTQCRPTTPPARPPTDHRLEHRPRGDGLRHGDIEILFHKPEASVVDVRDEQGSDADRDDQQLLVDPRHGCGHGRHDARGGHAGDRGRADRQAQQRRDHPREHER